MENSAASHGTRIKFVKNEGDPVMKSHKIYSNGHKMVRVLIDSVNMTFQLIDPVTGHIHGQSTKKYTNLEVVQRNAKKALKKFLNIKFEKEERAVNE